MPVFESFFERRDLRKAIKRLPDQALKLARGANSWANTKSLTEYAIQQLGAPAACEQAARDQDWYAFTHAFEKLSATEKLDASLVDNIFHHAYLSAINARSVSGLLSIFKLDTHLSEDQMHRWMRSADDQGKKALAQEWVKRGPRYNQQRLFCRDVHDSQEARVFRLLEASSPQTQALIVSACITMDMVGSFFDYVSAHASIEKLVSTAGLIAQHSATDLTLKGLKSFADHKGANAATFNTLAATFLDRGLEASAHDDVHLTQELMLLLFGQGWTGAAAELVKAGFWNDQMALHTYQNLLKKDNKVFTEQPPQDSMEVLQGLISAGFEQQRERAKNIRQKSGLWMSVS